MTDSRFIKTKDMVSIDYVAQGRINIRYGIDNKGQKWFFDPKDAEKVKSKRVYMTMQGDFLGALNFSKEKRTIAVEREEVDRKDDIPSIIELFSNHPYTYGASKGAMYKFFKVRDPKKEYNEEKERYNNSRIAIEVMLMLKANHPFEYKDLLVVLGMSDDYDDFQNSRLIDDMAKNQTEKFLSYFNEPKPLSNTGLYSAQLKDKFKWEAIVKRAIGKGVIEKKEFGELWYKDTKLGDSIEGAIDFLRKDAKLLPLIKASTDKIKG